MSLYYSNYFISSVNNIVLSIIYIYTVCFLLSEIRSEPQDSYKFTSKESQLCKISNTNSQLESKSSETGCVLKYLKPSYSCVTIISELLYEHYDHNMQEIYHFQIA